MNNFGDFGRHRSGNFFRKIGRGAKHFVTHPKDLIRQPGALVGVLLAPMTGGLSLALTAHQTAKVGDGKGAVALWKTDKKSSPPPPLPPKAITTITTPTLAPTPTPAPTAASSSGLLVGLIVVSGIGAAGFYFLTKKKK